MTQEDFQAAITRLAMHKIGPHEAAALFAIQMNGSTAAEIAERCRAMPTIMRIRLAVLVEKKLVTRRVLQKTVTYFVAPGGQNIIEQTLGTP
jgi:DNA-binding MarR family transcriptional regulator